MDAHFESVEKGNLAYVPTLPEVHEIYDTISVASPRPLMAT